MKKRVLIAGYDKEIIFFKAVRNLIEKGVFCSKENILKEMKRLEQLEHKNRKDLWKDVIDAIHEVGAHLNKVGNDDLNTEDYYFMMQIEMILDGYKKTYKKER